MVSKVELVKISDIVTFADKVAESARSRLTWSEQLRGTVRVSTPKNTKGNLSITVSVGEYHADGSEALDKSGNSLTGMARAYEYGSGIHASRGKSGTYVISPKNGKRLAFNWAKASPPYKRGKKLAGVLPDGRLSFFYVDHPGVKRRPYMKYALQAVKKKATDELKLAVRRNIKNSLSLSIREINGKSK